MLFSLNNQYGQQSNSVGHAILKLMISLFANEPWCHQRFRNYCISLYVYRKGFIVHYQFINICLLYVQDCRMGFFKIIYSSFTLSVQKLRVLMKVINRYFFSDGCYVLNLVKIGQTGFEGKKPNVSRLMTHPLFII